MPRAGSAPSPPRPSVDAVRAVLAAVLVLAAPAALVQQVWAQQIVGDAIPASLTGQPGDAARGRAIVANRGLGLCLLSGAGSRWSEGQLRLRIADGARLNADTIMPPYYRTTGLQRVARNFEGKTILSAAQVEDVVAYLATLKD
jgi:L-cysteine S-thiosulfotransferase